jgi:hypothetical protein
LYWMIALIKIRGARCRYGTYRNIIRARNPQELRVTDIAYARKSQEERDTFVSLSTSPLSVITVAIAASCFAEIGGYLL